MSDDRDNLKQELVEHGKQIGENSKEITDIKRQLMDIKSVRQRDSELLRIRLEKS
jgi:hypothetical protein